MKARLLLPLILTMVTAVPMLARDDQRELIDTWHARMAETESALESADYSRALRLADRTVSEMVERLGPGEGSTRLFSSALMQKAIAHAGLGERAEAVWYWQVVLGLDPSFAETDLSPFGEPAQILASNAEPQGIQSAVSPGQEIQGPKLLKRRKPKFPHGAHYFGVAGDLVVEVIVASDGSVREPRIVTPLPAATLSYAALEAVKRWRFEPARAAGQPIDVVYNLTVNYQK